jgi:hypothetical protein
MGMSIPKTESIRQCAILGRSIVRESAICGTIFGTPTPTVAVSKPTSRIPRTYCSGLGRSDRKAGGLFGESVQFQPVQ